MKFLARISRGAPVPPRDKLFKSLGVDIDFLEDMIRQGLAS